MDMEKAVALLSVFGLGMCFSLLGSISVKLMPRLKIDQGKFGSMISVFMFACLVASMVMGVTVDKVGYKPVAIFGFVLTSIGIFILAKGKTFGTMMLPCLLLGFGAMALNTVGNTLITVVLFNGENPVAALNLGNVFFGLGLFITPLLVSFLFRKSTYEVAVSVLGVIVLLPVIAALFAKFPDVPAGYKIMDAVGLLKEPVVLIGAFTLFCYISLESSFCNWLVPYGKEVMGRDFSGMKEDVVDAASQQMLSVFAIAMMAGRLIASQIATITTHGSWIIAGAALVTCLVILGMMKTGAIWTSVLAACAGFAFAPCFPTIVGVVNSKHPQNFGSVFGIIFAVGLAGAVIVPKAIGNLAKGSTVQKSLKLLIPACIVLVVLAIMLGKVKGTVG
jgi:MFS transporter, FHS family, glucose/mannose:H+ symporter